jgi:uncharacterized protein (DUF1501 family)
MDHVNAVPPVGAQYAQFQADRGASLAPPSASILALSNTPGCGLNAALPGIQALYNAGDAAIVCNIGPMIEPLNKTDFGTFGSGPGPKPYQLYSHNDQQNIWQTDRADAQGEATGWFGRGADLLNAAFNPNATYSALLSIAGRSKMLESYDQNPFQISGSIAGSVSPDFAGNIGFVQASTANSVFDLGRLNWIAQGRTNKIERSINFVQDNTVQYTGAASAASNVAAVTATFPDTNIGNQLASVARMIAGRGASQHRRQMFYVQMGGFDTHSAPFVSVNTALLQQLNDALTAFQAEMAAQSMANNVTLFTASDFGRALMPNSGGTDHGWGGHHFVIGGAINGGRLYNRDEKAGPILNTYPTITLGGPWDGGEGRLIPGISVSEFGATMMKWMGVPDAVSNGVNPMNLLFPLLPNFPSRDLGIMA